MSNIIEYNDTLAIHPGYYIEEQMEFLNLSQDDFAKKLDTTPKNLSKLINGEQDLSFEMALKLSKMLGTSVEGWLNLQIAFDQALADIHFKSEHNNESKFLNKLDYPYFILNFNLPKSDKDFNLKISNLRSFLKLANLSSLKREDLSASFKKSLEDESVMDIVRANIMTQIAINLAAEIDAPKFNKIKLKKIANQILDMPYNKDLFSKVGDALLEAGVKLVIVPHYPEAKIKGAAKRTNHNIVLMISDKYLSRDKFYFTLFHEIGHILNGDLGITKDSRNKYEKEELADAYAKEMTAKVAKVA